MIYILAIVCAVLALAADQFTKYIVITNMTLNESIDFLPGFMGFLEGYTWLLLSLTVLIMLVCIAMLLKFGPKNKVLFWSVCLILSGGLGNMIDRIFRDGKVIDFLHFQFIDFPVFNVADCAVVVGAGLLILYFVLDMIKESKAKRDL